MADLFSALGASNHVKEERAWKDLYCTNPKAVEELLALETFSNDIWEPCDGLGHISDTLTWHGYEVRRSDIETRGRDINAIDFLTYNGEPWHGDIITNPPYSQATEFIQKALAVVTDGCKVAMWLRLLFLEGKSRKALFKQYPPKRIWVSSSRIPCGKNGEFGASVMAYAWYIWEKGHKGETIIKWF